jgi:hypothetical protein
VKKKRSRTTRAVKSKRPFEKYRGIGTPGVARGRKAGVLSTREIRCR